MGRLPLVVLALTGCGGSAWQDDVARSGRPDDARLTVMTYNVNFGLAGDPEGIEAIRAGGADVVLLQETTEAWERALRRELGEQYPHMELRHCCRAGGLAVLSRFPFQARDYLPSPTGWFPAWRVVLETPIGPVQVMVLHLHPPVTEGGSWIAGYFTTDDERIEELEAFLPALDPSIPTILAGDLNESPGGRSLELLESRGFVDALGSRDPARRTWHWPTALGELSMQLDHILHDARLEVTAIDVAERGRSDHFPLVATLRRAR